MRDLPDLRAAPCPLWVKSRHVQCDSRCPLYPRKRTSRIRGLMLIVMRLARGPCSRVSPDGSQYAFAVLTSANGVRARINRSNDNDQFSM